MLLSAVSKEICSDRMREKSFVDMTKVYSPEDNSTSKLPKYRSVNVMSTAILVLLCTHTCCHFHVHRRTSMECQKICTAMLLSIAHACSSTSTGVEGDSNEHGAIQKMPRQGLVKRTAVLARVHAEYSCTPKHFSAGTSS